MKQPFKLFNPLLLSLVFILIQIETVHAQIKRLTYIDYLKNQGFQLAESMAPFYHGVASGDPLPDRVVIWTRVTPTHKEASNNDWKLAFSVSWKMATDTAFDHIVRSGDIATDESKDFTVKVDVDGLDPNQTYYYQFEAFGKRSIIGTTKTAVDPTSDLPIKLAFVDGNNYSVGYFSAYQRITELKELSAVVVLSGYIDDQEHSGDLADRRQIPGAEPVTIQDYRNRYAQYHLDKNLMLAHAKYPFIAVWENQSLNNSNDHAINWTEKSKAAEQAYVEWLPVRVKKTELQRKFSFGKMLDLIMIDTQPFEKGNLVASTEGAVAKEALFIDPLHKEWLTKQLNYSTANWKLLASQNLLSSLNSVNVDWASIKSSDYWDNHPKEKESLLGFLKAFELKNIVFISGGFNGSLASEVADLTEKYNPATGRFAQAVEIVVPSISSPSLTDVNSTNGIAAEVRCLNKTYNPQIKMANLKDHGFVEMNISQKKIAVKWHYSKEILTDGQFKLKSQTELSIPNGKPVLEK
ncbi:alkaline phosphatase D family protein [Solitalea lacus]|uniref:alkaline phosphatase D family protein n=1 Tax=Solitalea lacus TaxID=2911172 RepID=UPI001EDAE704|nr:alkaline phosphatase D family protein [Solitalea lacus]UKJ06453.1 alkaline phosphatase D family protein [Solitalea lacus]